MCVSASAQAPYRVNTTYEDTVRIAIIWNNPPGDSCGNASLHQPVGEKTKNIVVKALDTTRVKNVRVLLNSQSDNVSWADIESLWGANRLPHAIVHVNAGWSTGWDGAVLQNTLHQAVSRKIGVVSVGDDAASLADQTFGFVDVQNVPPPLGDATNIDSLWVGLIRANDNRLKVYDQTGTTLEYPGVNGIISNAVDRILNNKEILQFLPRNNGRCQADADRYAIRYPQWLTMLGYQQGFLNGSAQPDRNNDLNVLVAIQDTLSNLTIRRGVAVSFQPQFLENSVASQQIIYDAIMFASLAHTLSVPTSLIIETEDDTLTAGDIDSLKAYIIDQKGDTITGPTTTVKISWGIVQPRTGDMFVGNNYGATVKYTAIEAYRWIHVYAKYVTSSGTISDTAAVYVRPGPAHHLVIEGSPTPPNYGNHPIGGNSTITMGPAQTEARGYAILRDLYTNLVAFSTSTRWDTLPPTSLITARNGQINVGEGIVTKLGNPGITYLRAVNLTTSFSDTVKVTIENTTYDSLRIMQFDIALGKLVKISSLSMRTSDTTTLYVQGLRTDRLGLPGTGGWVDVSGNWTHSTGLRTNPNPPSAQNAWRFTPADTGHGTISVSLTGGQPAVSISAVFGFGVPIKLDIYPIKGNPGTTLPHPQPSTIADTVTAGSIYSKLYAKLFDAKSAWLSEYETNYSLSQQIQWSVMPLDETTLSALSGYSTTLTSTRAYRIVQVKATFNSLTDSVLLYVKADTANHLVIEASAQIRDSINDDPLSGLTIGADQTFGYVYAVLRDRFGNFVNYSKVTNWLSLDTTVFKADTGITSLGEGYAERNSAQGNSKIVAIDIVKNFKDTVPVEIQSIYYTALRMYLLDNGPKYIDTIRVHIGEQQTMYVEGMRSDNKKWELVPATWSVKGGLKTITLPPTTMADKWTVAPDSVSDGWIKVTRGSSLPDSVRAFFIPGVPNSIAIYKEAGNPYAQVPYLKEPQVNTVIAGTTIPLFAKIFDIAGNWLSSYENNSISQQLISWSITRTQGTAPAETLQSRNGNSTSFTPTAAYISYTIAAQFKDVDGLPITTQISFTVVPDKADHLVIEGTSNITGLGLNSDQPISQIEFGSRDTLKTAYAILRDRFGNLAQPPYSTSTLWSSLDTLIVKAQEGVPQVGEGKIIRIGATNQTKVVAINRQNPLLLDTVDIMIKNFSYDSLRIVVDATTRIESLTMRSDQDTILRVQGLLSYSGVWVPVESDWLYITTTTSTNLTKSSLWSFAPGDTGTGKIVVSLGNAVPDTIIVKILPGLPTKLVLYGKEGPVPDFANPPYVNPTDTIIDTAGIAFPLVAKIFDHRGVWLSEYELQSSKSNLIHWTVQEMAGFDGTGRLDDTIGHKQKFLPVKAYQTVYIISTISFNQTMYRDTILLKIVPGIPKQLVIEGSPDWKSSPNKPNPIDTVQITDSTTRASVFAVLRDSLGNFINYTNVSEWGVVNNDTIVTVQKGNINLGEGSIERKQSTGIARIYALEIKGFSDTTVVQLLPYHYLALRILCNTTKIDSLTMNTNQDTTLRVQGLRSDAAVWEDVAAKWENTTNLKTQPPAPGKAHSWRFSPTDTGTGWIRVTMENDLITKPDSIRVHFEIGPPVRATIEIVTPKELIIAGEPIKTVVTIYNEDGKIPYWCFDTKDIKFTDAIGRGGDIRPKPYVLLGNDTLFLSENFIDSATTHCFNNGVDTVVLRLFYVPNSSDSLHQITVNLGSIKASTPPFVLLPANLNSIMLEKDGIPLTDTLSLTYQDKNIIIFAIGYDKFGNRRGAETSNWAADSALPPISGAFKVSRIIYDATSTTDNSIGTLKALSNEYPLIGGNVVIKITAPLVTVKSATTRDNNGNGLIDGIDLVFSKSILLPEGFEFPEITIRYDDKDVKFTVDSVYSTNGQTDSVWHLVIHEVVTADPQTAWTPTITFSKTDSLQLESVNNLQTKDGAGPVVWKVTKEIVSLEDRKQDIVTIVFSEPVVREVDGSKLSTVDAPSKMFYVWEHKGTTYVRVDSILVGINNIISYNGTTLKFYTSNGNDISSKNFISLNDSIPYIKDINGGIGNIPNINNVKINVLIINSLPPVLQSVPNPASPTFARVKPGELRVENEPNARSWVRNDHGGTVITFPVVIPDIGENMKLRCKVKIHDLAGNVVIANEQPDILNTIPSVIRDGRASTYDIDLYWNGSNRGGMKVSPGIYKIVVSLEYSGTSNNTTKYKDTRIVGILGIGR